jgi:alkanesulfonate monooxygenase SsuD/methylene tetrahydromethanopterin reductase-like flavin-dependent oxidoreductase (luciferase family)
MWTQQRFSHQGRAFSMPERAVLPKPVQKPHPPMWVAVTSPGTELDAGERGLGALGLSFGGFEVQEKTSAEYRKRIQNCDPVGAFVNDQIHSVNFLYCHEDLDQGAQTGMRLAGTFGYLNAQLFPAREAYPTPSYPTLGPLGTQRSRREEAGPGETSRIPEGLAIGDPDRIAEVVRRWESVGVDGLNFLLNMGETVPQDEVLASLRLFASEVMPKFKRATEPAAAVSS